VATILQETHIRTVATRDKFQHEKTQIRTVATRENTDKKKIFLICVC
jgi:hypothetical protein